MKWGYYYYSLFTVRGVEIYGAHVSYVHFFGRSLFCAFAIGSGGLREGVGFELREREGKTDGEKHERCHWERGMYSVFGYVGRGHSNA